MIFTVLHAGGKFEHGNYKTAGGLHGVGASVVNALSKELVATVKRDGAQWEMRFKQGKPTGAAEEGRPGARHRHDASTSSPTPTIFPKIEFDPAIIRERLEVASYLHKGLKVVFDDETTKTKTVFEHDEGIVDYLKKIVAERGAKPVHEAPFTLTQGRRAAARLVLQWTEATDEHIRSLRQRHPDRLRRHARERPARRHRQGGPQLHRDAQPVAEGRDAHGRRHPRGLDRRPQRLHRRSRSSRGRRRIG